MCNKSPGAPSASNILKSSTLQIELPNKVRVLCLHGYRQNADSFKRKLGSLRKQVRKYAKFVFIDAPHKVKPMEVGAESQLDQRSWWFNEDDNSFKATNKNGPAFGFQESLKLVEDTWKKEGPFQGLLGFSQGACFVSLICGLATKKLTSIRPEFAVLSSGFVSGSLVHKSAYEDSNDISSLHIYGLSDDIIPKEMSKKLIKYFKMTNILEHSGGHYFPASSQQKKIYIDFFEVELREYLQKVELQQTTNAAFVEEKLVEIETTSSDSENSA